MKAKFSIARRLNVPIDSLEPHPLNSRKGDIPAIMASLQEHGQFLPLVIQKSRQRLVIGEHRWKAAKELGWAEVAVLEADIDDDTAYQWMMSDNVVVNEAT